MSLPSTPNILKVLLHSLWAFVASNEEFAITLLYLPPYLLCQLPPSTDIKISSLSLFWSNFIDVPYVFFYVISLCLFCLLNFLGLWVYSFIQIFKPWAIFLTCFPLLWDSIYVYARLLILYLFFKFLFSLTISSWIIYFCCCVFCC